MTTARVFNIERFATEDGPGIRTVVFLKGCGLRCKWCANPESQSFEKQIMFNANICTACEKCINVCPENAIQKLDGFGYITDNSKCNLCHKCIDNCYNDARSVMGEDYTTDELLKELLKDKEYYKMSGGGITFSGGEPLFYTDFIAEIADKLHNLGINVLVETCGYIDKEKFQKASKYVDEFFFDIKQMDPLKHKELCGEDNTVILENVKWLNENYKGKISLRYPFIPTCNDKKEEIEAFLEFVNTLSSIKEIWFLPYHRLGIPKYQGLGRVYEMGDMKSLKFKDIEYLKEYQSKYSFTIRI